MTQTVDPRLLELICARLCHDLVGPVSAIGNGVELVTEFGEDMRGEALELIAQSASEAARRLQFFRIAFGSAAGGDGRGIALREVRARTLALPLGGRVAAEWPEPPSGMEMSRAALKALLSVFLTAVDAAAGTGTVRVAIAPTGVSFDVASEGPKAALDPEVASALAGTLSAAEANPRTAVALHAHIFATEAGLSLDVRSEAQRIRISAHPAAR